MNSRHRVLARSARLQRLCTVALAVALGLVAGCGEDSAVGGTNLTDSATGGNDSVLSDAAADAPLTDLPPVDDAVTQDVAPDVAPDVEPDVAQDVAPDIAPDVAPDVEEDVDTGPKCPSDHCLIDGTCYTNLTPNPANPCQRCFALADQVNWSNDDTAKCDDGSSCTPDDHCVDGKCTGNATKDCNDGNACTKDDCTATGGCTHTQLSDASPCDDGNACTTGDVCVNSACLPGQVTADCDDKDSCTIDSCDVALGCEHTATGSGPCDDGNACTGNDQCGDGGCAGTALNCDDNSVCTIDSCDLYTGCVHDNTIAKFCKDDNPCTDEGCDPALGCVYPYNTKPCDDGDQCTTGDHCESGKCVVNKTLCDDKNPCTDDACSPSSGVCMYLANAATCTDDDVCTVGDYCESASCWPGVDKLKCDDGNPCTFDICDAVNGCQAVAGFGKCDDGNACTVGDTCGNKICSGLPVDCDDNDVCTIDSCDPASGCKHDNSIAASCKDDNICTDETCDPKSGCIYPFNTVACDDGNICTEKDACTSGACLGSAVATDDFNPCTDDSCDKAVGIVHVANTLPCEDGNVCTLNDTCGNSACQPGSSQLPCDDGNLCTNDACDPVDGCVFTANTVDCDDGTVCTQNDVCGNKECHGTAISCDDGNACTTDSCDAVTGCKSSLIINHKCRPNVVIDYPPRAATIKGALNSPAITILGHVTDDAGPITNLKVNGTDVVLNADGTFTAPMSTIIGGNEIVVVATDSFGTTKQVVQSFLWSDNYYKPYWDPATGPDHTKGIIDPGLAYFFSKAMIDDGDHSLPANDLATVFEQVFAGYNLSTMIPSPAATGSYAGINYKVYLSNLKYDPAKVALTPQDGSLHLVATINNLSADMTANLGWLGNANAKVTMTSVVITADLSLTVEPDHSAKAHLSSVAVAVNGTKITGTNTLGAILSALQGLFVGNVVSGLQSSLQNSLPTALEPAMTSAFNAMAFKTQFQIGKLDGSTNKITVDLYNDYSSITIKPDGMVFMLRPRASSLSDPAVVNYDELGIPARSHCGDGQPQQVLLTKVGTMELAISDDAFNELLAAVWNGGLLEFPVGPSLLGSVDLSQYGVSDLNMTVDAMLPPIMEDCAYVSPVAQVGDLRVYGSMKLFGKPLDFTMWATFKTDVAVTANNSAIGISLNGIKSADVQVDIVQDDMVGSEAALADLIKQQVLGALVGKLTGSALGSFPIPAINLNINNPGGGTTNVTLSIATDQVVRQEGNSIVQGHLQ